MYNTQYWLKRSANNMSLSIKYNPLKKGYYNVLYEPQKPLPPKRTYSMTKMLDKGEKVKRKSKTNLSLFG